MEEIKKYSIIGQVTIGTDEYRDLIEEKEQAIKEREDYSSKYWDYYRKCSELEAKNRELNVHLDQFKKYIKENGEQDKYELWLLKVSRED